MKLKPYYSTLEEDFLSHKIAHKRGLLVRDEMETEFPDLTGEFQMSVSIDFGKTLIRAFVYCPTDISDKDTRTITRWMKRYFGNAERNFREKEGRFYWTSKVQRKDDDGEFEFMVLIENTHPLTCEIVKVKKEVEVYESICK